MNSAWNTKPARLVAGGVLAAATFAGTALADVTTFDNGLEGWSVSGRENISPTGGNPGANLDNLLIDVFGAEIRNWDNPAFLGDFTARGPIHLTVDVKTTSISFFGSEVERDLIVELRDNTPSSGGAPYVSVWYHLGTISAAQPGWRTFSVDLLDPTSAGLPAGWGGTGAEDPVTFEPMLPADRTFSSVLASVDEIYFSTFVPGFFYGFTNFDIAVDNVGFYSVPEPTSLALLGVGLLFAARRR